MKQKILLLHGALGSKSQFKSLKQKLADTFEVFDLNFEGHGGRNSNQEFSIDLFTQNVIDFLVSTNLDQINIFGFSMGGYVGLNLALKHPNKVKKVITLGTKFDWNIETAQQEVQMLNPDVIEQKVPHFANKLAAEHHPNDWKEIMLKTANMMLALGQGHKLTDEDLKHINQPVIIGIGSLDNMVSFEESKYAVKLIPNAKLALLEGVKHPIEKNEVQNIMDFIASNS
jgi:esterase/lipase